ncbi:MAG: cation:proton antiporter domain-containing protein [Acidimicrobiales bacterium]
MVGTVIHAASFAVLLVGGAAAGLLIIASSRLTAVIRVPMPALVLVGAAAVSALVPSLHASSNGGVDHVVTLALIVILFDGGMHIGWRRFRSAIGPIAAAGVAGTFATALAGMGVVRLVVGCGWYASLLVATAVAPTDPTVVFSVLANRRVAGRSGTILEGESGANDPVGIALMASLVGAGGLSGGALAGVAWRFALEMAVGVAIGVLGGRLLLVVMRRLPLPGEGLYPLRTLAMAVLLYGLASLAHGSGFLAVFVAGIAVGDARAPFKREIERFHGALASLGEIAAFLALGLTVDVGVVSRTDVWAPGLVVGAVLLALIRPVLVGACLVPARLRRNERAFVLFAGLKGAVPILLAGYLLAAHLPAARQLYGIVVIVVLFSVVVQGGLVATVARLVHLPMEHVPPEPWAFGVRLRDRPDGVHQLHVGDGAPAAGRLVAELRDLPGDAWITLLVRRGELVPVRGSTRLEAGDDVTLLAGADESGALADLFEGPS